MCSIAEPFAFANFFCSPPHRQPVETGHSSNSTVDAFLYLLHGARGRKKPKHILFLEPDPNVFIHFGYFQFEFPFFLLVSLFIQHFYCAPFSFLSNRHIEFTDCYRQLGVAKTTSNILDFIDLKIESWYWSNSAFWKHNRVRKDLTNDTIINVSQPAVIKKLGGKNWNSHRKIFASVRLRTKMSDEKFVILIMTLIYSDR